MAEKSRGKCEVGVSVEGRAACLCPPCLQQLSTAGQAVGSPSYWLTRQ